MRLPITLAMFAALASPALAQEQVDSHREHYEAAMRCFIVSTFVSGLTREGSNSLPDNRKSGADVAKLYYPVMAYHGTHLGMKVDEITTNMNERYEGFSDSTLQALNSLGTQAQNTRFNKLVNEANACGRIPVIGSASE